MPSTTFSALPLERLDVRIVAVVAFLVAAPAILNGFTLDAGVDITRNQLVVEPGRLWELLTADYTAGGGLRSGFWRPLTGLLYWALWRLGDGSAVPFFTVIALLHAVCSAGVYTLARVLAAGREASLIGALLFAVHPVHTDVISGAVGLKDAFSSACFVLGLIAAIDARRRWQGEIGWRHVWIAPALFLLGLLAKESCIALPATVAGVDVVSRVWRSRAALSRVATQYALFACALLFKFGIQRMLLGATIEGISIQPADNPLVLFPGLEGRVRALALLPEVARLLTWPSRLSPDYSYDVIPSSASILSVRIVTGALIGVACVAAFAVAWRRREIGTAGAILVLTTTYLPASNLIVPIGTLTAERFLYLPSAGLCLLVGLLLTRLVRQRKVLILLTFTLCAAGAIRTLVRHRDWSSERTLWLAAYEAYPNGQKICHGAAFELLASGESQRAVEVLDRALSYDDPSDTTATILETWRPIQLQLRGRAHAAHGDLSPAVRDHIQAIVMRPDKRDWRDELGQLLAGAEHAQLSLDSWQEVARTTSDMGLRSEAEARAADSLGDLATQRRNAGDLPKAAQFLQAAVALAPAQPRLRRNLAIVLSELRRWPEAEASWRTLIALEPDDPLNKFNLALMLQQAGRTLEARLLAERIEPLLHKDSPLRPNLERLLSGR